MRPASGVLLIQAILDVNQVIHAAKLLIFADMSGMPDLRQAEPVREGITHENVVYDDIIESFLNGQELAHEAALIELSKNIDRFSASGEARWLTESMRSCDATLSVIEKQAALLKMMKKRLAAIRTRLNRDWDESAPERIAELPEWKRQRILARRLQGGSE